MPSLCNLSLGPLKKLLQKEVKPLGQSLSTDLLKSEDTVAFKALEELNQMERPKMGKMERFMSKVRGTGDKEPYPGKVKLNNFEQVDDTLYRGAMPESGKEFEKLKNVYKVKVIIDLRGGETTPQKYIDFGQKWAKHHGMEYVHMPMSSHRAPSQDELKQFFQIIEDAKAKGEKVYVHCKHGIDRTGSLVAAYEAKLGRSQETAYSHMKARGYNFLHKKTRPAQRTFVKGEDFQNTVQAAEQQRRTEARILPPVKQQESLYKMMGLPEPEAT